MQFESQRQHSCGFYGRHLQTEITYDVGVGQAGGSAQGDIGAQTLDGYLTKIEAGWGQTKILAR